MHIYIFKYLYIYIYLIQRKFLLPLVNEKRISKDTFIEANENRNHR